MGVSARDIFIALICIVGILLIINEEGTISFEKAFVTQRLSIVPTILPSPLIINKFKGKEGKYLVQNEVLRSGVALTVHDMGYMKHKTPNHNLVLTLPKLDSIFLTEYVATWGLYQPLVSCMKVGQIEYDSDEEYIAVFMTDWNIALYDTNGEQLWIRDVKKSLSDSMKELLAEHPLFEIHFGEPQKTSLAVLPYRVYNKDKGLVILTLETSMNMELKKGKATQFSHKLDFNIDYSKTENVYFAFDARTGEKRWQHGRSDFLYGLYFAEDKNKLEKERMLELQHSGEVPWSTFNRDLMDHFPHFWENSKDTTLIPDHFEQVSKQYKKPEKGMNFVPLGKVGRAVNSAYSKYRLQQTAMKQHLRNSIQKAPTPDTLDKSPNVLVVHKDTGIEVLHLYTGRTVCQINPLLPNRVYSPTNLNTPILYSFSSRRVSSAFVQNKDILNSKEEQPLTRRENSQCMAIVEAGAPGIVEQVFSTDVCQIHKGLNRFSLSQLTRDSSESRKAIALTKPITIMYYNGLTFDINFDTIYLASNGLITSIGTDSDEWKVRWQTFANVKWDPDEKSNDIVQLLPFRLKNDEPDSYILAIARGTVNILDKYGKIHHRLETPSSLDRAHFLDINDDGINDIVITTLNNYEGYITRIHSGRSMLGYLVICFVLILGIMNLSTMIELSDPYFTKADVFRK